jgi:hypothetical protein
MSIEKMVDDVVSEIERRTIFRPRKAFEHALGQHFKADPECKVCDVLIHRDVLQTIRRALEATCAHLTEQLQAATKRAEFAERERDEALASVEVVSKNASEMHVFAMRLHTERDSARAEAAMLREALEQWQATLWEAVQTAVEVRANALDLTALVGGKS